MAPEIAARQISLAVVACTDVERAAVVQHAVATSYFRPYTNDDVVGVELGGEVGRLLPSELSRLLVPELELDALRRISEREHVLLLAPRRVCVSSDNQGLDGTHLPFVVDHGGRARVRVV